MNSNALELLAPARTADIGIQAILHGADAVYIGGPAFGARADAGNSLADIARLTAFARRFHARVFVALNTIFDDHEIDAALALAWQLYDAGADALIVQDMGLLELDLPPIQLHASTQTDIRSAAKARFLGAVGFSQIVLARELDLAAIREIRAATDPAVSLEFFVHGALCVAFSGQCYISHAHTGRSANRGECSQACRLPYTLEDGKGRIVAFDKHLLSMKDNDQSNNLAALADAGIRSFKIEGRLKSMAYVKNATAHWRTLLDALCERRPEYRAASSGRVTHHFVPQPEKSFNRGSTDYFVGGRQDDIGAFETPKFAGTRIGTVSRLAGDGFDIALDDPEIRLHNGDGLSYQPAHNKGANKTEGLRINQVAGLHLTPNVMPADLAPGMVLYRNRDQAFERLLEQDSATRKIAVSGVLDADRDGLRLTLHDADGISACARHPGTPELARDAQQAEATLRAHLGKTGDSDFVLSQMHIAAPWFLPVSAINRLRRAALAALVEARAQQRPRLPRATPQEPPAPYPERELSYLANVFNRRARDFYRRHGVELIADAYEANTTPGEVSLMITKHCLRYSFKLCPKEARDWQIKGLKAEPMTLVNGRERLTLKFDCKACEMHVMGSLRKSAGSGA